MLVTGATGLVGCWLVSDLLDAGADVVCLVRDWVPQSELVRSGDAGRVRGRPRRRSSDSATLERALGEYEIDTVFHLGAQTIVGVANRNPVSHLRERTSGAPGTCSRPAAARRPVQARRRRVVATRRTASQDELPYTEDTPLDGAPSLRRQQVVRAT